MSNKGRKRKPTTQEENGLSQESQDKIKPQKNGSWQLQYIKDLPKFLQDNEYLLYSHRPELPSIRQCVKSAFTLHTETCNIWTHVIGCMGTVVMAAYYFTLPVSLAQKMWFSVFFAGAILCMGCSGIYHTMLCYSESANKHLAKVDYCGIIVLIVASFPPWVHYCFFCSWPIKCVYLILVSVLGSVCIYFVVHEKFATREYRPMRAGLFIALGLTGVFPAIHYLLTHPWNDSSRYLPWLLFMALLYIAGGVIYAMRIPERLKPGMFDIWCHSHQVLHICVVGGVISCYCGISKIATSTTGIDCANITTVS